MKIKVAAPQEQGRAFSVTWRSFLVLSQPLRRTIVPGSASELVRVRFVSASPPHFLRFFPPERLRPKPGRNFRQLSHSSGVVLTPFSRVLSTVHAQSRISREILTVRRKRRISHDLHSVSQMSPNAGVGDLLPQTLRANDGEGQNCPKRRSANSRFARRSRQPSAHSVNLPSRGAGCTHRGSPSLAVQWGQERMPIPRGSGVSSGWRMKGARIAVMYTSMDATAGKPPGNRGNT